MDCSSRYLIGPHLDRIGARLGVEVGVAFGEHAEIILDTCGLDVLFLVDPWGYVPGEDPKGYADAIKDWQGCYDYCAAKMKRFGDRAQMVRLPSVTAAAEFPEGSLDFVYIDANHMRPYIDRDLAAWYPKVRSGGIFGGHDYHTVSTEGYQCHVYAAVNEFLRGHHIHVTTQDSDPSWYIIKP